MADLSGRYFGRYHILRKIGQGGMASVYMALDTRLERHVALKVLNFLQDAPDFLKRFEREAKALGQLSHPNIVGVIDYGEHEGMPFLVMEFLSGGTLRQFTGKALPWSTAAHLLAPIARALDFAHSRNIVHRDVKPANILFDGVGTPMLTDFGIAKILSGDESMALTGTGVGMGTPEYMAPEQCNARTVDHRADIYALGIIFYELVTGRTPYRANTPLAVALMHMTEPLPNPREFVPDLPQNVERVIIKALAKEPSERYATAADFALALEDLAEEERTRRMTQERLKREGTVQPTSIKLEGGIPPPPAVEAVVKQPVAQPEVVPVVTAPPEKPMEIPAQPAVAPVELTQIKPPVAKPEAVKVKPAKQKKSRAIIWIVAAMVFIVLVIVAVVGISLVGTRLAARVRTQQAAPSTSISGAITTPGVRDTLEPGVTPAIAPGQVLNSSNAAQFMQIGQIGRGSIEQIFFANDNAWTVIVHTTGVTIFDTQSGEVQAELSLKLEPPIAIAGDGRTLASASSSGVMIWQVAVDQPDNPIQSLSEIASTSENYVERLLFSPDNQFLVAVLSNGEVNIWRLADGELLYHFKDITSSTQAAVISPNSDYLAASTLGDDQYSDVFVWNLNDGSLQWEVKVEAEVYQLCFAKAGQILVTGDYSSKLAWWDIKEGKKLFNQTERGELVCSPAGNYLAVSGPEPGIEVWDFTTNKPVSNIVTSSAQTLRPLSFSPDGKQLISWSFDAFQIWRVSDGRETWSKQSDGGGMPRAVFSPDGQLAAFSSGTWQTYEWNSRKPGLAFELQGFMHYPRILLSPDGRMLASFSEEEARIALWDVNSISMEKTIQPIRFLTGYYNSILSMAFSPDSQYLATSSYEDKVVVWNTADSGVAAQLVGHGDTINQVEFSPDGRWLASASSDMTIRLWKTGTWETVTELRAEAYPVEGIRFSPDGRYLASWNSFDGTHVWRLSDFERAFDYGPGYDPVFSPNGEKIAFETEESKVLVVRNIADGSEYNLNCRNPLFTPDSALLACANESGQVILYTADGVYLRTLEGWTDTPFLFSSDGRLLVGVSGSQIMVWTVTDGTLVATWDGHHQYVFQLTISPDNTFIVSSSFDGTIRLWGLPSP